MEGLMIWLSAMIPAMAVLTFACWLADTDWAARISEKLDRYMK